MSRDGDRVHLKIDTHKLHARQFARRAKKRNEIKRVPFASLSSAPRSLVALSRSRSEPSPRWRVAASCLMKGDFLKRPKLN